MTYLIFTIYTLSYFFKNKKFKHLITFWTQREYINFEKDKKISRILGGEDMVCYWRMIHTTARCYLTLLLQLLYFNSRKCNEEHLPWWFFKIKSYLMLNVNHSYLLIFLKFIFHVIHILYLICIFLDIFC